MQKFIPTFVDENGEIKYHPLVDYIRSGDYGLNPPNNVINLVAGARSQLLPLTARSDGYLILTKMMAWRTGGATIRIVDQARQCQWMNNEVHMDTICGIGGFPAMLPETKVIEPTASMLVEFRDLSGFPNRIDFNFGGAKLYHENAPQDEVVRFLGRKELITYPYFMTPDIGAFTIPPGLLGGVSQQFFTMSDKFDFEIFKINAIFDEDFTYEIRHRGDTLSNNAQVHCMTGTGIGAFPYVLPQPFMFRRNERIEINFTNLSPINPNVVYFTLIGRAIALHS